jgi:alpha-tubulin suppressor-like RCC1 family protein
MRPILPVTRRRLLAASLSAVGALCACSGGGEATEPAAPRQPAPAVAAPVASVAVTPPGSVVAVGLSVQLAAVPRDAGGNALAGRAIMWATSDTSIATVSATGLVMALRSGDVTITARSEGVEGSAGVNATLLFSAVATGAEHSCGLTTAGDVFCWGANNRGQLGNGTTIDSSSPVAVRSNGIRFVAVDAGATHSCALTTLGDAYCWGAHDAGQLGNSTTGSRSIPAPVAGENVFRVLSLGETHSCALASNGGLYCWGGNATGALGDGTIVSRSSPTAVAGALVFESVSAGGEHTCATTRGGGLYCWGVNAAGQLGNGTLENSPHPVRVDPSLSYASVSAGTGFTCSVTLTGDIFCWGANDNGQFGNGRTSGSVSPIIGGGWFVFTAVSAGNEHSCGVARDGQSYCWGYNGDEGYLGVESIAESFMPVAVTGNRTFVSVSASDRHTCGRTSGGVVYCWGANGSGQLGDGTRVDRQTPVRAGR